MSKPSSTVKSSSLEMKIATTVLHDAESASDDAFLFIWVRAFLLSFWSI